MGEKLGVVVIIATLVVVGAFADAKSTAVVLHPTEAEAAANRKALALQPIQTEGIIPLPAELPVEPRKSGVKIKVSFVCPHCGKSVQVEIGQ